MCMLNVCYHCICIYSYRDTHIYAEMWPRLCALRANSWRQGEGHVPMDDNLSNNSQIVIYIIGSIFVVFRNGLRIIDLATCLDENVDTAVHLTPYKPYENEKLMLLCRVFHYYEFCTLQFNLMQRNNLKFKTLIVLFISLWFKWMNQKISIFTFNKESIPILSHMFYHYKL